MNNDFENSDPSKRSSLLNSGYKEFSIHGTNRSSLNKILKKAGVSKGFFYHYFNDKETFLDYLITYGVEQIIDKLNNEKLLEDKDFIRRLQKSAVYKNELLATYPDLMRFFTKLYQDENSQKLKEITESLSGDFARRVLTENVDYTLFRDDIEIDSAIKIVSRYVNQLAQEIEVMIHKMNFQDISSYYEKELEDLKKIVYKKGQ